MINIDKEQTSPTRRLSILYISSLAVVACLSITGQVIIQRLLSQQRVDIQVISNVQYQQILSQRLAKLALALKLTQDETRRQILVTDFEQTIIEWETTEKNLEQLENSVNVSGGRSVQIRNIIEQIHPNCKKMVDAAKQLLSTTKSGNIQPRIRQRRDAYLFGGWEGKIIDFKLF